MAEKAELILTATDATGPAIASAKRNVEALGKSVGATAQQHQIAAVQVKDFIEQIISGGSPIRAFAQQGAAVVSNYGGVANTFRALTSLLTPATVGIAAVATSVGFLGAAYVAGAAESKAFSDAIRLSGNFAGQTAGQFDAAAKSIAASSNLTQSAAKEFGQALIKTGQIGPQNFRVATEAAARYGAATGKTAEAVAGDFASMGADVAKWAATHNQQLHFITAAQYEQIKALQDSGREVQAQGVVYDALNQHLHGLDSNLGLMDRSLANAAKGWDAFWTSAKGVGKAETVDDEVAKAQARIAQLTAVLNDQKAAKAKGSQSDFFANPESFQGSNRANIALAQMQLQDAQRRQMKQGEVAYAEALRASTSAEGIAARQRGDAVLDEQKGIEGLTRARAKDAAMFRAAKMDGKPFKPEEQARIERATTERFAETPDTSTRQKTLEGYLKNLQQGLENEHDLVQFAQGRLDELYRHGDLSIQQFYDAKQALANEDLKATTDTYDEEIAELRKHQAAIGTGSEAGMTPSAASAAKRDDENKINDLLALRAKAIREVGQAAIDTGTQTTRAVETLNFALADFDAGLKDLGGDKYGAELLRNAQRMEAARRLLGGETGGDPARLAALKNALQLQADANKAQADGALQTEALQRAEEMFNIQAQRDGLDRTDTERGLLDLHDQQIASLDAQIDRYGELIRRSAELNQGIADPALVRFYENLKLSREKAFDARDPAFLRFVQLATQAGDTIAQSFEDAVFVSGKLSDKLRALGKDLARLVIRDTVTKPLAASITQGIKSLGQPSPIEGGTNLFAGQTPSAAADNAAALSSGLGGATTALGLFTQALGTASSAVPVAPGIIPTSTGTIGLPAPVSGGFGGVGSDPAVSGAAVASTDAAIAKLSDSASAGADKLSASTGAFVQNVSLIGASMGGLPGAFARLLASLFALTSASSSGSSAGFLSAIAKLFTSGGAVNGPVGSGGTVPSIDRLNTAIGGTVPAFGSSNVSERGPELLTVGGRQILLMGNQPGTVTAADRIGADASPAWSARGGSGGNVYITNNTPATVSASKDDNGDWRVLVNAAAKQAHQMVAADHASGSGPSSAALRRRGVNLDSNNPRRA